MVWLSTETSTTLTLRNRIGFGMLEHRDKHGTNVAEQDRFWYGCAERDKHGTNVAECHLPALICDTQRGPQHFVDPRRSTAVQTCCCGRQEFPSCEEKVSATKRQEEEHIARNGSSRRETKAGQTELNAKNQRYKHVWEDNFYGEKRKREKAAQYQAGAKDKCWKLTHGSEVWLPADSQTTSFRMHCVLAAHWTCTLCS